MHVAVKLAGHGQGAAQPQLPPQDVRTGLAQTRLEPLEAGYLVATEPAEPTISRRGVLAFTGAGSALVALPTVGQSAGAPLRRLAPLALG